MFGFDVTPPKLVAQGKKAMEEIVLMRRFHLLPTSTIVPKCSGERTALSGYRTPVRCKRQYCSSSSKRAFNRVFAQGSVAQGCDSPHPIGTSGL